MPQKINLVIADDHEIFRDGLAMMLKKQKHLHLVAQAENGLDLVAIVKEKEPDIVITDIKMPRMDGVAATQQILKVLPNTKIIALSMFDEENLIVEMLEAGARGYLLKNADKSEILDAINVVSEDQTYYCRHTTARLATMIVKSKFEAAKKENATFNKKELDVIKLICLQYSNQEISEILCFSKRTVEGYRTKIFEKMNVRNVAGIVVYALKHGIISEKDIL